MTRTEKEIEEAESLDYLDEIEIKIKARDMTPKNRARSLALIAQSRKLLTPKVAEEPKPPAEIKPVAKRPSAPRKSKADKAKIVSAEISDKGREQLKALETGKRVTLHATVTGRVSHKANNSDVPVEPKAKRVSSKRKAPVEIVEAPFPG